MKSIFIIIIEDVEQVKCQLRRARIIKQIRWQITSAIALHTDGKKMTMMNDETYLTTSSMRRRLAEEAALFIARRIGAPSVAVTAQTPRL